MRYIICLLALSNILIEASSIEKPKHHKKATPAKIATPALLPLDEHGYTEVHHAARHNDADRLEAFLHLAQQRGTLAEELNRESGYNKYKRRTFKDKPEDLVHAKED